MEPRLGHSSCVRFGKIVTPHTYRDSHATADGSVLKDISLTRWVVNYDFVARVFSGEDYFLGTGRS